jgi:tRNA C32,U32 (ribose-2'-O)-methylase TrmJ
MRGRMDKTQSIIERVTALLDAPAPDAEKTLMDGYARALELEGERSRLERRLAELTNSLSEGRESERLPELRSLRERIATADAEVSHLRTALSTVRRRVSAASAAAPEANVA